jgi:WD40 repeat protein
MSVNPQLWQPIYNKLCPSNSRQFWSQSAADALVFQRQTAGATLPTSPNNVVDYRLACLEFLSHSHRWLTPCPSKTVALHDQALKSVDFRPESQKKSKSPFKTDEGGRILAMAMAPRSSNMWCALATKDHKLHLRDARSGRLLRCTEVHHSGITQLEFSNCSASQAKSSLLVGASRDGSILLWDVQAAKDPVVEYDLHTRPVHSLAVSDNWCLSGGVDGGVYALHLPSALTGKQSYTPLCLQGGGGTVESLLLWDGAEGVAVAAGLDRVISVWSLPGFSPPADVVHHNATRLEGHTRDVTDMCWISSTSPTLFASCGRDNTARVWNLAEQRCVTVLDRHSSAINRVVAVDESKLFTACDDRLIRRFDIETGVLESTYTAGAHGVTMMAANRHRIVAANPRENVLYLFDPRSAKRAGVLTPGATGPAALSSSASSAVSNVSTMRIVDEDRLLVGHKDGAAFMYDFRRLKS